MSKVIRVDPEVYKVIKAQAKMDKSTIGKAVKKLVN